MRSLGMALARWSGFGWLRGANDDEEPVSAMAQPTSVQRMARRFPALLPNSSSAEDFAAWVSATGADVDAQGRPVSGDDLHDLYLDVCELAGWDDDVAAPAEPLLIEAPKAPVVAVSAPPAATPKKPAVRASAASKAASATHLGATPSRALAVLAAPPAKVTWAVSAKQPEAALAPLLSSPPSVALVRTSKLRPALEADDAAQRFLEAMPEGAYIHADLTARYLEHAATIGHDPTPENMLREALALLPGVRREVKTTGMRQAGSNRKERRLRSTYWHLKELKKPAATSAERQRFPATDEVRQSRAA